MSGKLPQRRCRWCQRFYTPSRTDQKYCGDKCRYRMWAARNPRVRRDISDDEARQIAEAQ